MVKEIRKILEEYKEHADKRVEEVKRHFDILKEDFDDKVKTIIEYHQTLEQKLKNRDKRLDTLDWRLDEVIDGVALNTKLIKLVRNGLSY